VPTLIIANNTHDWSFTSPLVDVEVVDPQTYLASDRFSETRGVKLFNLCDSYEYQTTGYYVSLLAEARGHRPSPSITTLQDLRSPAMVRLVSEELEELIQTTLARLKSDKFILSIYFGRNMARRYDKLSLHLFNVFQSPLLRAKFVKNKKWELRRLATIPSAEVPMKHWPFVMQAATEHFAGRGVRIRRQSQSRYDMAILVRPDDPEPPSNAKAIRRFVKAGESLGLSVELIEKDDFGRIAEFDALFIRETTAVNHYTYRFARRAAREGLVVIDDPHSIVRCTNKVYLAELLNRHEILTPRTLVVHRGNAHTIAEEIGFPVVLKKPDSAFSQGVMKAENAAMLAEQLDELFQQSELVVAQEFLPTTFDWRIGIFDRRPLFACKYFMAPQHWQIIKRDRTGDGRYGKLETLPVELAPRRAVSAALKAANLIGDGLYGVDVKQAGSKFYVIEVNDNPNLDSGVEDEILRDELYRRIMAGFLHRIERMKSGASV
jgi:glutathione synthase/RimK-type ligase-like ATP-grasp enzyme